MDLYIYLRDCKSCIYSYDVLVHCVIIFISFFKIIFQTIYVLCMYEITIQKMYYSI